MDIKVGSFGAPPPRPEQITLSLPVVKGLANVTALLQSLLLLAEKFGLQVIDGQGNKVESAAALPREITEVDGRKEVKFSLKLTEP